MQTVNTFKALTPVYLILLMLYAQNFSTHMIIYCLLHSSYSLIWLVKEIIFPDGSFKAKQTLASSLALFLFCVGYWMIPIPLIFRYVSQDPPL